MDECSRESEFMVGRNACLLNDKERVCDERICIIVDVQFIN